MDTRKVAAEYRLVQWAQMLGARVESGQSIKEFCRIAGISRNTYFYWQRKLRQIACERLPTDVSDTGIVASGFTQVKVTERRPQPPVLWDAKAGTPCQLQLEVGGVKITADSGYPPEKLASLLREFLR